MNTAAEKHDVRRIFYGALRRGAIPSASSFRAASNRKLRDARGDKVPA